MNTLGLFVKHPIAGHVKTRLAELLGSEKAAGLYAAFIVDLASRFRQTADQRCLCFAPGTAAAQDYFELVAGMSYRLWTQPEAVLGERMRAFFAEHFRNPEDRVVIIGSDSPTLPRDYVERAFELLSAADCVIGPATDGGYYLLGQRGETLPIFEGIDWSTSRVFAQTVDRLSQIKASLALLPPWYDVDKAADWQLLRGHIQGLRLANAIVDLDATCQFLGLDIVNGMQTL